MTIKVVFLPFSDPTNPYQRNLAAGLAPYRVEVSALGIHPLQNLLQKGVHGKLDLVHLHWVSPYLLAKGKGKNLLKSSLFILTCLALRAGGVKLVWSMHNLVGHESRYPEMETFFRKVLWRICHRIITHCPNATTTLSSAYNLPHSQTEKIAVIPYGHFIDDYPNQISRQDARAHLGLDQTRRVWLYFGLIRPYKNVNGLIEQFKRMEGNRVLLVAGKPQNDRIRLEIQRLAAGDRRILAHLDFIPADQVQIYMNAADLVVLPFTQILTSSSVMLAASFAKAVVTPAMGCSPFLLARQKDLLYDPGNQNGLKKALKSSREMDLVEIGQDNLEIARCFPWRQVCEKTHELYLHCMEAS